MRLSVRFPLLFGVHPGHTSPTLSRQRISSFGKALPLSAPSPQPLLWWCRHDLWYLTDLWPQPQVSGIIFLPCLIRLETALPPLRQGCYWNRLPPVPVVRVVATNALVISVILFQFLVFQVLQLGNFPVRDNVPLPLFCRVCRCFTIGYRIPMQGLANKGWGGTKNVLQVVQNPYHLGKGWYRIRTT